MPEETKERTIPTNISEPFSEVTPYHAIA